MNFGVWHNGNTDLPLKEADTQLEAFADRITPYLEEEFPGR